MRVYCSQCLCVGTGDSDVVYCTRFGEFSIMVNVRCMCKRVNA